MPTYIYETIPASCCDDPIYFEIEQTADAPALSQHPESGLPIRRSQLAGSEVVKPDTNDGGCCGPSGCC